MAAHLTAEQRQLALRLKVRGLSLREIGPQVGCSHQGGVLYPDRRPARGRRPPRCRGRWPPLAAEPSTGPGGPTSAPSSGPGGPRPRSWPVLGWPPRSVAGWPNGGRRQELSARSRIQFPGDPMMWVSHQSIYQACTCRAAASCAGSWPAAGATRSPRDRREPGVVAAGVLATAISLEDHAGCGVAGGDGVGQRVGDQVGTQVLGEREPDHAPRRDVHHGGQLQPPLPGRDIGDGAAPAGVDRGGVHGKVPADQIGPCRR
jgi:hypothetical protein